jgi:MFS family permease
MTRPFVPFMVARFFNTEEADGLYVGILGSAFHVAQVITLYTTAWPSSHSHMQLPLVAVDGRCFTNECKCAKMCQMKYGRKPCLLSGLAGSGLAMLMFGLSSNYVMAVSARFISGNPFPLAFICLAQLVYTYHIISYHI